jgi:hypothetical protein
MKKKNLGDEDRGKVGKWENGEMGKWGNGEMCSGEVNLNEHK